MAGIGSVNFDGLVSGLDTKKLIEDLLSVDSRPLKRLEKRQSDLKEKSNIFDAMKTNLLELKDKAFEVKNTSTLGIFSASSTSRTPIPSLTREARLCSPLSFVRVVFDSELGWQ